ncbi:glycosyltransferase family 2 protein [Pelagibacteraceae bacterium]|jgi:glycosyltransferase involved in cell wall biosynthesis|nr:glycosyltransferase family 2 protein [Pelagibacteraceae bacterium]
MKKELVTVYITNFNYSDYIEKSISSVLSQSYKNIEIIIVDDNSKDGSKELLKKYIKHPKIKIIFNKKNLGLLKSSNIAIKASSAKYIMRLDADDFLDKRIIEIFIKKINTKPNIAMVYSDYYEIDVVGKKLGKIKQISLNTKKSIKDRPILAACCLFKKEALFSVNLYDESFTRQDGYDIWYKLFENYNFEYVPKYLFFYRKHQKSLTKNDISLFKTRTHILNKFARKKFKKKKTLIIIPIRDQKIEKKNYLKKIKNKPILFHTIDECLKIKKNTSVLLTTSDIEIIKASKQKYKKNIIYSLRNDEETSLNENVRDGIIKILKKIKFKPDILVLLSAEYPFKRYFYIEQAISKLLLHDFDKIISTTFDTKNNYYQYSNKGIKLISNEKDGTMKYEKKVILKEAGGIWAFNYNSYLKDKYKKISNIIVDADAGKNLFNI